MSSTPEFRAWDQERGQKEPCSTVKSIKRWWSDLAKSSDAS